MGDNSESHASENSSAVSDDDASSDASSYDDDPDYPLAAPRPAQPVATTARVPPIGRLPLGGISGGLSTGRPLLGLERSQASASAASAQPGLPGNFKLEALSCSSSKETSSSMARRNDALPPIPRCETPKGFVKPPKLTLTRHADESMGEETQSSAPQSIDTKHVMTVSLLSHGLALDRISAEGRLSDSSELAKTLLTRASSALGIKSEELSWFEIRPLDINSQSLADCTQVAVAVNRSGFSLAALEDLLLDNKRLASAAEKSASSLESMQNLMRDQTHSLRRSEIRVAEQDAELRRLQEKNRAMEREIATLRQQLQRSDGLRLQGQHALDELKHEFEALTRDLAAEHLPHWPPANLAQPLGMGQAAGSKAAQVLGNPNSDRLANVLSRLCDESVLRRLESCLGN